MTHNPIDLLNEKVGRLLLRLAVTVQTEMMRRLNLSAGPRPVRRKRATKAGPKGSRYTRYTTPSKPGEYLRKRTGHLQAGILYEPTTAAAVGAKGSVRIGYTTNVWYGGWWEVRPDRQRRKGLIDLVAEMAPQLQAVAVRTRAR